MKATILTRMIHSRGFSLGVTLAVLVCACLYYFSGFYLPITGNRGLAFPSANVWLPNPTADFVAGLAGAAATALIMVLLNKIYNVLRSYTYLYIALFAAMQLATADLLTQFYTGTILAVIVPLCQMFLFPCFRAPMLTRHVFVIFLLLSLFTATQYCFALFIPVFLIGLGQMRIFNVRSVLAALMGAITPWWLMLGFGFVEPHDISLPQFASIFSEIGSEDTLVLLVTIGITVFAMLLCYVLNLLKTIAYNARARAINGSFTLTALFTIAAACIDYRNILSYVPLLNYCAAMEITHYFSTHKGEKSFIPVFILLAAYAAIFVCQIVI